MQILHASILKFVSDNAPYIKSHTMVELFNAGHEVTVFDSFCDIRDQAVLTAALRASGATAAIHFAGLKAVGESIQKPLAYHDNNRVDTVQPAAGHDRL